MERVDLSQLQEFTDTLRSDIDASLRPGVDRAGREVQTGVRFGSRTVSGEVAAGTDAMTVALARAKHNGDRLIDAAEILVAAATTALQRYAAADLSSAQQLAAIESGLRTAAAAAAQKSNEGDAR